VVGLHAKLGHKPNVIKTIFWFETQPLLDAQYFCSCTWQNTWFIWQNDCHLLQPEFYCILNSSMPCSNILFYFL